MTGGSGQWRQRQAREDPSPWAWAKCRQRKGQQLEKGSQPGDRQERRRGRAEAKRSKDGRGMAGGRRKSWRAAGGEGEFRSTDVESENGPQARGESPWGRRGDRGSKRRGKGEEGGPQG